GNTLPEIAGTFGLYMHECMNDLRIYFEQNKAGIKDVHPRIAVPARILHEAGAMGLILFGKPQDELMAVGLSEGRAEILTRLKPKDAKNPDIVAYLRVLNRSKSPDLFSDPNETVPYMLDTLDKRLAIYQGDPKFILDLQQALSCQLNDDQY